MTLFLLVSIELCLRVGTQLTQAAGAAACWYSGSTPCFLLPQGGPGGRHSLCLSYSAGETHHTAAAAGTGDRHLRRAWFLDTEREREKRTDKHNI